MARPASWRCWTTSASCSPTPRATSCSTRCATSSRTGRAGLLFLIPGLDETLRVNGRASLTRDPEILARHEIQEGRPPRLAIGIEVEEAFLHCAKAFIRSDLWEPESWRSLDGLARPAQIWKDHAVLATPAEEIEEYLVEAYANDLYWEPVEGGKAEQ